VTSTLEVNFNVMHSALHKVMFYLLTYLQCKFSTEFWQPAANFWKS